MANATGAVTAVPPEPDPRYGYTEQLAVLDQVGDVGQLRDLLSDGHDTIPRRT